MRLSAGIIVERMEHRVTWDGLLMVELLLGNTDDDDSRQYRVTTLSATTLYDRSNCRGYEHDDDNDDDDDDDDRGGGDEETVTEQELHDCHSQSQQQP